MMRRARMLSVVGLLVTGALLLMAATQTWLNVRLNDGSTEPLEVVGSAAVPLLMPLSLAALAIGAALSITGPIVRYVLGGIALLIGAGLVTLTVDAVMLHPVTAAASTVTKTTGIAGVDSVAALVTSTSTTLWPFVAIAAAVLLTLVAAYILVTARTWRAPTARHEAGAARHTGRPKDAVESWDDLSRGEDPTDDEPSR